jgi:hypothetical protein
MRFQAALENFQASTTSQLTPIDNVYKLVIIF